jgi:hypothetical protein
MKQIKTFEELKSVCTDEFTDFMIRLNGGLNSSKQISMSDGVIDIIHEIDFTEKTYETEASFIKGESFLMEAMNKGAFYKTNY